MQKLNITAKIWLSIGIFILGFVFSTVLAQVQGLSSESGLRTTSAALFPAAQRSQEAEGAFQRMVKGFSDAVMTQDASGVDRASEEGRQVVEGLKSIAAIPGLSPARAAQAAKLASSISSFVADARSIYGGVLANPASMTPETQQRMHDLATQTDAIKASLQQVKEAYSQDLRGQLSTLEHRSLQQRWVGLLVFLITLVVAGVIVHLTISRSITGVLDLAVEELRATSSGTAAAASHIASSSNSLAQGSSEQAASLEEISASSEEISSMTQKNAHHSKNAAEKMSVAARQIEETNTRLREMVVSMQEISASGDKISKIIRTIDEIAFQTNILALNAAVEAARAGAAGLGFAVVADEVRTLAHRCADAAKDTAGLIEDSIGKTQGGKIKLDQVAETIRLVTASSAEVKVLVDEIRVASDEQSRGMRQVSTGLSKLEEVTQRNAAGAEESASAAEQLSSQSKAMELITAHLEAIVKGSA